MSRWFASLASLMLAVVSGCGPNAAVDTVSESPPEVSTAPSSQEPADVHAMHTHSWAWGYYEPFTYFDANYHKANGYQRCSGCGAIQYGTHYLGHQYSFTWWAYYKYSSTQHEYKREYRCSTCGHVKNVSTFEGHHCESIWDTQCGACGYTHTRMCG